MPDFDIVLWLEANYPWLLTALGGSIAVGAAWTWFIKVFIPALFKKMLAFIATVMMNLMGLPSPDGSAPIVQASPMLSSIGNISQQVLSVQAESTAEHIEFIKTKLLDYALKLHGGVLSQNEAFLVRQVYDSMLDTWSSKLPLDFINSLANLVK